ncbi:ThiF family adenylyltransferase, partial [Actinoplanes sp. NPDC005259]|uniref:HesA/MoeB/ThiF family protein n=1 Tax=Actinoplanes sp. NPDC005259 TaxID=3154674 RepID=UPI0033ACA496
MSSGEGRYARQSLIPDWDQSRLSAATFVLAGMGALGNEVAKNLALLGAGRLIVCDRDTVATSNLSRSVLFAPDDVGEPKAVVAARALARLAPSTVVSARVGDLINAVGGGGGAPP